MLTAKEIDFILDHEEGEPERLLLEREKYKDINVPLCVNCIIARKKIKKRLPLWYATPGIIYPNRLSAEQCSSQAAAQYKTSVLQKALEERGCATPYTGADLTAGLGVDTYCLSSITSHFHSYEKEAEICHALEENMKLLGRDNISVTNIEISPETIEQLPKELTFVYADPARRYSNDRERRKYSIAASTPNLTEITGLLLERCEVVMAKLSPMADIRESLRLLPQITELHIVALDNECKELLAIMQKSSGAPRSSPLIKGINIVTSGGQSYTHSISLTLQEEERANVTYSSVPGKYLYEPDRQILKCGAFKLLSERYRLDKLSKSSHLYTSGEIVPDFPGKIFIVRELCNYSRKRMAELAGRYPFINLVSRNFPIESNRLKSLYKIKDGGTLYLFATTLHDSSKVLIVAQPLTSQAI